MAQGNQECLFYPGWAPFLVGRGAGMYFSGLRKVP